MLVAVFGRLVWMEAIRMEVDGLVATGTFAEVNEIPKG